MDSINEGYVAVADTVLHTLQSAGVKVQSTLTWSTVYHHGYTKNPFDELVEQTYIDTRSKCDTHAPMYVCVCAGGFSISNLHLDTVCMLTANQCQMPQYVS